MQTTTVYTLGHSNRSLDELMNMLADAGVHALVDVRAQPHSSRYPHFSADGLRSAAEQHGMIYHWAGRQLGGRREVHPQSRHIALDPGLQGYADYMETDMFQRAVAQLLNMASTAPLALLCAERLPEDCHRGLIADYLLLQGVNVVHLVAPGEHRQHQLSPAARRESAELVYDRAVTAPLDL